MVGCLSIGANVTQPLLPIMGGVEVEGTFDIGHLDVRCRLESLGQRSVAQRLLCGANGGQDRMSSFGVVDWYRRSLCGQERLKPRGTARRGVNRRHKYPIVRRKSFKGEL